MASQPIQDSGEMTAYGAQSSSGNRPRGAGVSLTAWSFSKVAAPPVVEKAQDLSRLTVRKCWPNRLGELTSPDIPVLDKLGPALVLIVAHCVSGYRRCIRQAGGS